MRSKQYGKLIDWSIMNTSKKLLGLLTLLYMWTVTSFLIIVAVVISYGKSHTLRENSQGKRKKTVAFFHPYCNAGGGGERVLWAALRSLQQKYSSDLYQFVIYTGDVTATPEEILTKARTNFNIYLDAGNIEFVYLSRRSWIESDPYPVFTLLGQSLGSLYLGIQAITLFTPDVYIDTMGYAFTLPLFKFLGRCRVAAYVHYPTISTDMLDRVVKREAIYNNANVANSATLSNLKVFYYQAFAWIYSIAGRVSEVTMVNSSWTEGHILKLWKQPGSTFKCYPPCDVTELNAIQRHDEDQDKRLINIVSVALFRPEKDHALQVKAMAELRKIVNDSLWNRIRLVLLGGIRNEGDQQRVEGLRQLAQELDVQDNVVFQVNFTFKTLKEELTNGLIGIHTMLDEHFGISVVECMAAGLIMVAHRSGGPLMDIVTESPESKRTGFLAANPEEYAAQIKHILQLSSQQQQEIRDRARSSVVRFSDDEFSKSFNKCLESLLQM